MEQTEQAPISKEDNKSLPSNPLGSRAHKYRLFIEGVTVLLIIAAGIYFFTDIGKSAQVLRAEKKAEMLKVVNSAEAIPLSEKQKIDILNTFGGSNTAEYNFTPAEKDKILRALNAK